MEVAFWAGLSHFANDGFKLGDPSGYLHPPGHPHTFRPVFSPPCEGCSPPVHGQVRMLVMHKSEHVWRVPCGVRMVVDCAVGACTCPR